jgi:hypothetical protein
MPIRTNQYTVIRDTREQAGQGWFFEAKGQCLGTEVKKLDTGDYTLVGFERVFTIERKGTITEFVQNLLQPRFDRELERMEEIELPFILLEFDVAKIMEWPHNSGIPRYKIGKIKTTPQFILKKIYEYQCRHPYLHFIFAGDSGREIASCIFKRVLEAWDPNDQAAGGLPRVDK